MTPKKSTFIFVSEAKKILIENGLIENIRNEYTRRTARNKLTASIPEDQSVIYSVFAWLETPSPRTGNPYSGKVNFHSSLPVLEAIADFEDHIKELVKNEL